MKDIRTRVLQYFKNGADKMDLCWKNLKVQKYNTFVPVLPASSALNDVPDILKLRVQTMGGPRI